MNKTISTTIRIPETLKNSLEKAAKQDNRSFNNLINIILMEYIKKSMPDKEEKEN